MSYKMEPLVNIRLNADESAVIILDQTQLPNQVIYKALDTPEACFEAIYRLEVRGAPAIGIFAAYSAYILARKIATDDTALFLQQFEELTAFLTKARPTAVNLSWALNRMVNAAREHSHQPVQALMNQLAEEAKQIHLEDMEMCRAISANGLSLLHPGDGILTHCNAGPLATSSYGTGLGPILLGQEQGYDFKVFTDETRPLLQGARLTTFELEHAGVDVTLICDNMASIVMKNGWIQACLVGCDRIAANGDIANKVGTSGVAVLAKHYGIPFYVLGPSSTIDFACAHGGLIPIEERPEEEIKTLFFSQPDALPKTKCYNPAFDVTDHTLITAIITEKGICYPPFTKTLK